MHLLVNVQCIPSFSNGLLIMCDASRDANQIFFFALYQVIKRIKSHFARYPFISFISLFPLLFFIDYGKGHWKFLFWGRGVTLPCTHLRPPPPHTEYASACPNIWSFGEPITWDRYQRSDSIATILDSECVRPAGPGGRSVRGRRGWAGR